MSNQSNNPNKNPNQPTPQNDNKPGDNNPKNPKEDFGGKKH